MSFLRIAAIGAIAALLFGASKGPVASWDLDEGQGSFAVDGVTGSEDLVVSPKAWPVRRRPRMAKKKVSKPEKL